MEPHYLEESIFSISIAEEVRQNILVPLLEKLLPLHVKQLHLNMLLLFLHLTEGVALLLSKLRFLLFPLVI